MRILVTIPHFYSEPTVGSGPARHGSGRATPDQRIRAVSQCILALHRLYGGPHGMLNIAGRRVQRANERFPTEVHVVVSVTESAHLLDQLPLNRSLFQQVVADVDPRMLGFHCRRTLRDRWGNYDYYCYLEDDLILHDPWLFMKLEWFNQHVGDDKLLLPNRFEFGNGSQMHKLYVDGDLLPQVTARFQNLGDQPQVTGSVLGQQVTFRRPLNPHSGCYFLNARQMEYWIRQPHFLDQDVSFVGPLESAATLGVMKTFKIYKPAIENASFLEVQHYGNSFLNLLPS